MAVPSKVKFIAKRLRERLWVKPLAFCALSIAAIFVAKSADRLDIERDVPSFTLESIETLLAVLAASMLVIATFAVASMVSAYASASSSATPRSFTLIIADDVSQNALSTFIGAFIYSIVALTAVENELFGEAGLAALFALTAFVFGVVILTFVRWVDRIARLGRLSASVEKVEAATAAAMAHCRDAPALRGVPLEHQPPQGQPVYAPIVGYVQHIDIAALQTWAEKAGGRVAVSALPGTFAAPGGALAYVQHNRPEMTEADLKPVVKAFVIGRDRLFDEDPRFGLVALSEIASKALSPGVNDPGTAVTIIGSLVRLFAQWAEPPQESPPVDFDRVDVPILSTLDMFDDAFRAIARDGAGTVEVMLRLQKGLRALSSLEDSAIRDAALTYSRMALARAEKKLDMPEDLALVRDLAAFSTPPCIQGR